MTLVEFLRGEIAKDEAGARDELAMPVGRTVLALQWRSVMWHVLTECEAKKRILVMYESALETVDMVPHGMLPSEPLAVSARSRLITAEAATKVLAAVYAGRPGYREEWAAL